MGDVLKRSPLKRGTKGLKRTRLKPMSEKRRLRELGERRLQEEQGAAFKRAIAGERCVVCGKTRAEAVRDSGYGHQAHHAIRQSALRKLGLADLLWAPALAVCTCNEPCHRQHTTRVRRIKRSELPRRVLTFVREHGLELELEKEYPE